MPQYRAIMCIFYQEYEKMLTLIRVSVKYVSWLIIRISSIGM